MKKLLIGLLLALPALAQQTSNSLPFKAYTTPPAPVLTSLSGLSPSGGIYVGTKMPIIGTGFASGCVVNVDGTAQASSTFSFISATEIDFTIPAALGSTAGTSHTLTVSCPLPQLSLVTPVTLPNVNPGVQYSADLGQLAQVKGGVRPYTFSLTSGSLPTGLTLSQSGVVSGKTSSTGSFTFSFTVVDSSGQVWKFDVNEGKVVAILIPHRIASIG